MRCLPASVVALALTTSASLAFAVPGPDSVAVLANANDPDSVALAHQYAAARQIPDRQVCTVDVPMQDDITLDVFRTQLLAPFQSCLMSAGVMDRIEAVVLTKGVPMRVSIPDGTNTRLASLTAVLGIWQSTMTADHSAFLGQPPGTTVSCGTPCYGARWRNPFNTGPFSAGWTATNQGVEWHLLLVTRLDARSYTDAARLITSATMAEQTGGARGEFLLMQGADPARAVLDGEYPGVITALQGDGDTANEVPFDSMLTGHTLAALFVGTASLGTTIEGNTYLPGSLVDNLTSLGADPVNFHATGEDQVSIARWVAMGVAGVHGCVSEPLNNAFPNRALIVDYAEGSTLGESFLRRMPFVYWQNLVLGDVMAAPYATRPVVTISGATDGEHVAGARDIVAHAVDPMHRTIATTTLFVDGVHVATAMGDTVESCVVAMPGGSRQILAVAQIADDGSPGAGYQPKGWSAIHVQAEAGPAVCSSPGDGGVDGGSNADASGDGARTMDGGTGTHPAGCGCRTVPDRSRRSVRLAVLLAALMAVRTRRTRRPVLDA